MTGFLPGRCIQIWIASIVSRRLDDARREKWGDGVYFRTRWIFYTALYRATSLDTFGDEIYPRSGMIYRLRSAFLKSIAFIERDRDARVATINFFFPAIPLLIFSSAPFVIVARITRKRLRVWHKSVHIQKKEKKNFTHMASRTTLFRVMRRITAAQARPYLF